MSLPMVGETLQRGPKGKESGLVCILKLSGKKTALGEFSGETPVGWWGTEGASPQSKWIISQVKTQRHDLETNRASVFNIGVVESDKT